MCKAYTVHFIKPPCTPYCGGQLTTRIRPCPYRGTPVCRPEPDHQIKVSYRCAMHFQATVYPNVDAFTRDILTHTLPHTTTDPGSSSSSPITKLDALDPDVATHIQQFGGCMYIAYQEEYYEAARTATYMQLHGGALPPGVEQVPRRHGAILRGLYAKLREAYARFCDGDRWVAVGVPRERQPERGRFFYQYPLLGGGCWEQLLADVGQQRGAHYSFADIFDGMGWDMERRGGSLSSGDGEVGEDGGDDGVAFEKERGPFCVDDLDDWERSDLDSEDEYGVNENDEDTTATGLGIREPPVGDDKNRLAKPEYNKW
ncbi:predicted protein [Chaetomium globosum CBS 148.51]|uniref:Uncharacterized protein n=1 Tax=Chaetomium globosum (strain ATCC 6205 / CBS 148.51 / DSM 1962 / NBRC 6347 / NRRL 1970) TaxID=306901 RepID=Q2HHG4_CHAGB|nr:uncharacterized protein CHGG_00340 [Chaetomium globosum CBS 148.51]EAQ92105.1 predicted protein [Chaetomium globosum CBS 148.51]